MHFGHSTSLAVKGLRCRSMRYVPDGSDHFKKQTIQYPQLEWVMCDTDGFLQVIPVDLSEEEHECLAVFKSLRFSLGESTSALPSSAGDGTEEVAPGLMAATDETEHPNSPRRNAALELTEETTPAHGSQIWTVNARVIVQYPEGCFPGVITAVPKDILTVKFLRPHKTKKNVFVYPESDDIQMVSPQMVIRSNVDLVPSINMREWGVTGFDNF